MKTIDSLKVCTCCVHNAEEVSASVKVALDKLFADAFGIEANYDGLNQGIKIFGSNHCTSLKQTITKNHPEVGDFDIEWMNEVHPVDNPDGCIGFFRITKP